MAKGLLVQVLLLKNTQHMHRATHTHTHATVIRATTPTQHTPKCQYEQNNIPTRAHSTHTDCTGVLVRHSAKAPHCSGCTWSAQRSQCAHTPEGRKYHCKYVVLPKTRRKIPCGGLALPLPQLALHQHPGGGTEFTEACGNKSLTIRGEHKRH